jgi:hypothetical protein
MSKATINDPSKFMIDSVICFLCGNWHRNPYRTVVRIVGRTICEACCNNHSVEDLQFIVEEKVLENL